MRIRSGRLGLVAAVLIVGAVAAVLWWPGQRGSAEFRQGDLVVTTPWARATPGTLRVGAAYLTIANRGAAPDRLLRAETAVAERAELHTTMAQNGVMQMRPVESVALPPGQTVHFDSGGMHFMLVNLTAPLAQGGEFEMRLVFERSGILTIQVPVFAVGAIDPSSSATTVPGSH